VKHDVYAIEMMPAERLSALDVEGLRVKVLGGEITALCASECQDTTRRACRSTIQRQHKHGCLQRQPPFHGSHKTFTS
jgi:hypothetical protein